MDVRIQRLSKIQVNIEDRTSEVNNKEDHVDRIAVDDQYKNLNNKKTRRVS